MKTLGFLKRELKGGLRVMEKPYNLRKALVHMGNSVGVIIPNFWIVAQAERLKIRKIVFLNVECFDDKLVITVQK